MSSTNARKSKWESDESDSEANDHSSKRLKQSKKSKVGNTSSHSRHDARNTEAQTSQPTTSSDIVTEEDTATSMPISPVRRVVAKPVNPPIPTLHSCRHVDNYEKLNRIEEGAYGVVFRARDRKTGDIVALKKFKLEKEKNGFPITSLREIRTLMLAKHPNIVNIREIVVGDKFDQIFMVMDFIDHDLKSLMEDMKSPFLQSEVKTIMIQLLSAVALMHDNWMIHRDLKTSNLLLNNRGQIKVADFGLARTYGSPLGNMTQLVVTLWYRAPELLLGAKEYSTAVDMWSIGCIFAELVRKEPLLPGRSEIEQLDKIFKLLGMPNDKIWPGFSDLPHAKNIAFVNQPYNNLRSKFLYLTEAGIDLMSKLLTYDPKKRISAEEALNHPYFSESPAPKDPAMFPTWPSKGSGEKRKTYLSPSAPQASHAGMEDDDTLSGTLFGGTSESTGFQLRIA
ncbi:kinase-like domain-containing protein [Umbelopsis sp. PMI_123]|nr:kinase-like domain-containing protein [Umbelopsis sp. PMI_123]